MESTSPVTQDVAGEMYTYAAELLVNQKLTAEQTKNELIAKGLDGEAASIVVVDIEKQIHDAKKERAKKDMLYGALWCIGGIIATASDIGLIFWGAILFGGIQFFKGVANS